MWKRRGKGRGGDGTRIHRTGLGSWFGRVAVATEAMIETTEVTSVEKTIKKCGGDSWCATECNGLMFENVTRTRPHLCVVNFTTFEHVKRSAVLLTKRQFLFANVLLMYPAVSSVFCCVKSRRKETAQVQRDFTKTD